jgi:hypothetical protein
MDDSGMVPTSAGHPPTTTEYLHALGRVYQDCRASKTVTQVVRELRGRLSRQTLVRLEHGDVAVTVRSEIELAAFYGLTFAEVHRRAWALLGHPLDTASAGTVSITLSRKDRDAVLRVLTRP